MLQDFFNRSDFFRNLSTLVTGAALAQVINFAFTTYFTRVYSPSDFGSISIFTSIVSFILVVSCGKFDVALVAAKEQNDSKKLFTLSLVIMGFVSVLTLLFSLTVYVFNIKFYSENPVYEWFLLLPISVLMLTGGQVFWMWNVRQKRFKNISYIRVVEVLVMGFFAVTMVRMGALGLLLATLIGQAASFFLLGFDIMKKEGSSSFRVSWTELRVVFKKYLSFPTINIIQGFTDIFQVSVVVLIISGHFETSILGFYALCMRVLQVPMRLVILPVSHVFFAEASECYRTGGNLYGMVRKNTMRTALLALPIPLLLLGIGPSLFATVFGETWREAGVYAQILSGWIFFDLVRAPIAQVASIIGKQKQVLYMSVAGNLILLGCLIYGVNYVESARVIFGMVSASQALTAIFLILLIFRISKTHT